MFIYEHSERVRYADTDQMGYVYYGNYSKYYEIARVESLRSLGLSYKKLEATGIIMPVAENHSKYLRPGTYDELLRIKTMVRDMPTRKVTFEYEIFNENDEIIHTGRTILVFVDQKTGKSVQAPSAITNVLKPYFDEE